MRLLPRNWTESIIPLLVNKLDWNLLTAVATVILAVTGFLALVLARQQLKQNSEEAQVQHLLALNAQYEQEPMVTYRKVCAQKRLAEEKYPPEEDRILSFFETVALLVNRGYLKDMDVWETFSTEMFPLYADAKDAILEMKKDDPPVYANLVSLMMRLESIEFSLHGTASTPTKDDIREFWQDEVDVMIGTPSRHRRRRKVSS
jgi:hypothetical protein